ncbi:MAG: TrmH family RNA methyltransferase [Patescibacteria group bacterium]
MKINTLIYDVTYPSNIGEIIRTSHVLGEGTSDLYFYDPRNILDKEKDEIENFSCNIASLKEFKILNSDINDFLKKYNGRKIATLISDKSTKLKDFNFEENDLILFGNERTGLPDEIIELCDEKIIIPMKGSVYNKTDHHLGTPIKGIGEYPTLKVSIAHAIVLYGALE